MKKIIPALFALVIGTSTFAQDAERQQPTWDNNHIKLNVLSLPLRTFSLQYERGLTRHVSAAVGFRLQPKGGLPFKETLLNKFSEDDGTDETTRDFIKKTTIGNWAITPEVRFYFGKKPLNGFYAAPFARIGSHSMDWTYKFNQLEDSSVINIGFNGRSTSISGGLLLGAQWHVGEHFLIDWWIAGPMFGSYSINLKANTDFSSMSASEQQTLKENLEGLELMGNSVRADVNDNGARVETRLSLPGFRTGLCIGYTF